LDKVELRIRRLHDSTENQAADDNAFNSILYALRANSETSNKTRASTPDFCVQNLISFSAFSRAASDSTSCLP